MDFAGGPLAGDATEMDAEKEIAEGKAILVYRVGGFLKCFGHSFLNKMVFHSIKFVLFGLLSIIARSPVVLVYQKMVHNAWYIYVPLNTWLATI